MTNLTDCVQVMMRPSAERQQPVPLLDSLEVEPTQAEADLAANQKSVDEDTGDVASPKCVACKSREERTR